MIELWLHLYRDFKGVCGWTTSPLLASEEVFTDWAFAVVGCCEVDSVTGRCML